MASAWDTTKNVFKAHNNPLPRNLWASRDKIWQSMMNKEEFSATQRRCRLYENPKAISPLTRFNALKWIMNVCKDLQLRRETYYLAVDYIDRYLTINPTSYKSRLFIVSITSLVIASKVEEVHQHRLKHFPVSDIKEDVLECEKDLLKMLQWNLAPMTPSVWLSLFMQIYATSQQSDTDIEENFLITQYDPEDYVIGSHIMDLFSLDPGFMYFNYRIIAASTMHFLFGKEVALTVSGLRWSDISNCVKYMTVFHKTIKDSITVSNINCIGPNCICQLCCQTNNAYRAVDILVLDKSENYALQSNYINIKHYETAVLSRLEQWGFYISSIVTIKTSVEHRRQEPHEASETDMKCKRIYVLKKERRTEYENDYKTKIVIDYFQSKRELRFYEILKGVCYSLMGPF